MTVIPNEPMDLESRYNSLDAKLYPPRQRSSKIRDTRYTRKRLGEIEAICTIIRGSTSGSTPTKSKLHRLDLLLRVASSVCNTTGVLGRRMKREVKKNDCVESAMVYILENMTRKERNKLRDFTDLGGFAQGVHIVELEEVFRRMPEITDILHDPKEVELDGSIREEEGSPSGQDDDDPEDMKDEVETELEKSDDGRDGREDDEPIPPNIRRRRLAR